MPASPQSGYVSAPAQPPAPSRVKRPRKPADEHRSINIALYVGGLVLTAAALAFVAAAQDPVLTAVSLLIAYLIFAGTGLWLSSRVAILKPAGIAIFGTSLALLAVTAIPLNEAFINNGYLTWAIVSATGLIVYGYASIHLDSRVLGYLVVPFLYSSIFSSNAVLQVPLVWTLTLILVASALVQLGVILAGTRVPAVLRRPFGQLHWMVVPGVLIAALLLINLLGNLDYLLLFGTAAAYYAVNAIRPVVEEYRPVLAVASRLAATVALLSILAHLRLEGTGVLAIVALWFSAVLILLVLFPALDGLPAGQKLPIEGLSRGQARRWDLGLSLALAVFFPLTVQARLLMSGQPLAASDYVWLGLAGLALLVTLGYTILGLRPQVTSRHRVLLTRVLRCTFAATALIPLAHHPWLALFWLAIWASAEIRLSAPAMRGIMHRAQAVAALGISGWMVGQLTEDPRLGARLALLGIAVGAAAVVVLLLLRGAQSRGRSAEPAVYWLFAAAGFSSGAGVFGLTGSASPVYAVAAMTVIYATAVLVLLRTDRTPGITPVQLNIGIRTLGFAAAAAIAVISIEWDAAWAIASTAQAALVTYALAILLGFGAAEFLAARALSPEGWGRALGEQVAPALRAPELWPGTHLAAHGIWAGLLNLAVFSAAPVLDDSAAQLWWLTVPAWGVACWAGLRALGRTDREELSTATRLLPSRIYGALAVTGILLMMFSASGSSNPAVWWAQLVVAGAAALMATLAFQRADGLPESAVLVPVSVAAGAYLVGAAVTGLWRGSESGHPADLLMAATLAMIAATWATRILIGGYATPSAIAPRVAAPGTAAAVVLLLGIWHLTAMPGAPSTLAQPILMMASAGIAMICLHLLLHWALRRAVVIRPARTSAAGPQTAAVSQNSPMKDSDPSWVSAARLSVFAATVLLALLAIDLPLATDRGVAGDGPEMLSLVYAAAALVLAGLIFGSEVIGARQLSQAPSHRWVPVHLGANALWLAAVNLLMLSVDLHADLWWFTAVPWAAASVIFTRGAAQSASAAGQVSPLPVRDLIAARAYALGALFILLGTVISEAQWWVQAVAGAAAVLIAAGTLLWGSRVPEAPYAVPFFVVAGAAVLLVSTLDQVLGGVALWSAQREHWAALGYLVSAGVFLILGVLAMTARRLWTPGPARLQLMLVTGTLAVLISLSPLLSAQYQAAAGLAWVVPGMHLVLILAALRIRRLRDGGALVGSILLPLSALFAYSMATPVDTVALAVTLFLIIASTLTAEAVLYLRGDQTARSRWQLAHWLTAGAAATLIALTSLGTDAVIAQFITLGAAAVLLVAGLLRGVRLGLYWGAAIIVISILWALRQIMFLFLIVLGALIIGAAIWRLVAVQKKQKDTPDDDAEEESAANTAHTNTEGTAPSAAPPSDYRAPSPPDSGKS